MLKETWESLSEHVEALVNRRRWARERAKEAVETAVIYVYGEAEEAVPVEVPAPTPAPVVETEPEVEKPRMADVVSIAQKSEDVEAARAGVAEAFQEAA